MLTVKELREFIADLPGELPVYLGDWVDIYTVDMPCDREDVRVLDAVTVPERYGGGTLPKRLRIGGGLDFVRTTFGTRRR